MIGDEWYESEKSTRSGLASELRRIARRTKTRPFRVIIVAALITAGIFYKMTTKPTIYDAKVVLVVSEESLRTRDRRSLPVDQLREYVLGVLLPSKELLAIVEKHKMFPLRKQLGDQFALDELWQEVDVSIWKNSFVEIKEGEEHDLGSAHIGITVSDRDPVLAFAVAQDISAVIRATAAEQQQKVTDEVAAEVAGVREGLGNRAEEITTLLATKLATIVSYKNVGRNSEANSLEIEVAALYREQKQVNAELSATVANSDSIADLITTAGLDMTIEVVDEERPEITHQRGFVLVMILVVIAFGALFITAFVLGAFDSKVHDGEDVERLGLPLLGHVPGFAGDHVGSLQARGAMRSRVPSVSRWRSHR